MNGALSAALLRKAALEAEDKMLAELDKDEASPHEFSAAFKEKMRPLLKKARRREKTQQTLRAVAASLAIVIFCGIIWVATYAEAREAVQKWFKFTWNNIITYRFTEEYTDELPTYRPTWLPEGYKETDVFETKKSCSITYENENGDPLFFYYQAMDDGASIGFLILSEDEVRHESVNIKGSPGDFYICFSGNEQSSLIWMDEKTKISFGVDSYLNPDIILQIAESVSIIKQPK